MVKFSKELEAQLIPEWKEAFVNYWLLKKQVKKIKLSRSPDHSHRLHQEINAHFGRSVLDPIRVLAGKISAKLIGRAGERTEIIQVIKTAPRTPACALGLVKTLGDQV